MLYGFSVFAPVGDAYSAVANVADSSVSQKKEEYILHNVQAGDTLESVARLYSTNVDVLVRANQSFEGKAPTVWLVPSNASTAFHSVYTVHVVRPGETISIIAATYNRSVKELVNLNSTVLPQPRILNVKAGDRLIVPVVQNTVDPASAPSRAQDKVSSALSSLGQSLSDPDIDDRGQYIADQAVNRASGMVTSAVEQNIESFLNNKGTAKVGINANVNADQLDYSLDYLHPLIDGEVDTLFAQVGTRTSNERNLGNVGLGYRSQVNDGLVLGVNAFIDHDFGRSHTRGSLGMEAWVEAARLSTNVYAPLSGWKNSKDHELNSDPEKFILQERPAKGWDINVEGPIPGVPQLALTAEYFQWKGDKVDAQGSRSELEKDPKGYSVGVKWQPMPLLGFVAEHSKVSGSDSELSVGLDLTWDFDLSLKQQLNSANSFAVKPLDQARKELVRRNNDMVLEYREKHKVAPLAPLKFPVDQISGTAGQHGLGPQVEGAQTGSSVSYSSSMPGVVAVHPVTGYLISAPNLPERKTTLVTITANERTVVNGQSELRSASYLVEVHPQSSMPTATNLDIKGILQVGQVLTCDYVFADNDADTNNDATNNASTMVWTGGGTAGNTSAQYSLTKADVGRVLTCNVKPKTADGAVGELARISTANAPGASGGGTNPPGSVIEAAAIPTASNLNITGVLQVGQTLTGSFDFADNDGVIGNDEANNASTVLWSGGGTVGHSDKVYTLSQADTGKVLTFSVTPKTATGAVGSVERITTATAEGATGGATVPVGGVIDPNAVPEVSNLEIVGDLKVGQVLEGNYLFNDHDGDSGNDGANDHSIVLWSGGGTKGNTTNTYQLTSADTGKVLAFNVKARNVTGRTGNFERVTTIDPIKEASMDVTIHIVGGAELKGSPLVGQTLEAKPSCQDACEPNMVYQWKIQKLGSADFEVIPGATERTYTPQASQQKRALKVTLSVAEVNG